MTTGKVVRFDDMRGYGFIAPDDGSGDIFVHVNDLLDDKHQFRSGLRVAFEVEEGDRGLKASEVRIVDSGAPVPPFRLVAADRVHPLDGEGEGGEDEICDLLSPAELQHEVTESLLTVSPPLSADQILHVRERVLALARSHRWTEA
ncbi:cold-shock protein [Streptomyces sp. NPDC059740]|uniref:cold-shock protein n=1 Tax=Streptomyces sp. NPDC059740 TaxID=3346926 RepID=UPI00366186E1